MSAVRLASEAGIDFPYGWPGGRVHYFTVVRNIPTPMVRRDDMRAALSKRNPVIYAVWPGQWSSDMFLIDDVSLLRDVVMPR